MKVIRLVGRHSVEEIVLKRASSKLELTNTVIEGGQVYRFYLYCNLKCILRVLNFAICIFFNWVVFFYVLQFSHGTTSSSGAAAAAVGENSTQLADILKFGLDHLLQNEERYNIYMYMYIAVVTITASS